MHHIQTRYNILHILFWMISCCINGFVAIYLKSKGLDNTLIGIVTGSSCILITLISPFVTSLLNKIQSLTIPKLITCLLSVASIVFLMISYLSLPAGLIMLCYIYILTAFLSCVPLVSTIAMNYIAQGVEVNFGLARGMGSVSYATSAVVLSNFVEWFDPNVLSVLFLCGVICLLIVVNTFPDYHEEKHEVKKSGNVLTIIKKYKLLFVILLGWSFTFSASTSLSTYLINVVEHLGGNTMIYGFTVFAMAASEMPAMAVTRKLMRKFDVMTLIVVAGVSYLCRNILIAMAPSLLFVFIGVLFQSTSYGLLTSTMAYYVTDTCEKEDQIMGQTLLGMMTTGLGSMLGNVVGGILQDTFGLSSMLVFAMTMTVIGALILIGVGITHKKA